MNNTNINKTSIIHNNNIITGSWGNKKNFSKFRDSFSFKNRIIESSKVLQQYPNCVPVICENFLDNNDNLKIDKNKYLVPNNFTIGNFLLVIKKRFKINKYEALFIMIDNKIPPLTLSFKELYYSHKDTDGFLYMTFTKENVFG